MAFNKNNGRGLRVMTYNIRTAKPDDGKFSWENRKDEVSSLLRFHKADIIGLQEVLYSQLQDIDIGLHNEYSWIGCGQHTPRKTSGEYCPIFFKKDTVELLSHGTFWLSKTPEIPGSKNWGTAVPRICTWGQFKLKERRSKLTDSKEIKPSLAQAFYVFNTHFDSASEESRKQSAKLILQKIEEITKGKYPVFFVGGSISNDFFSQMTDVNAQLESETVKILCGESTGFTHPLKLQNARSLSVHRPRGPRATYTGLTGNASTSIDHIFLLSKQQVKIVDYAVLTDVGENNLLLSDHRAVIADVFMLFTGQQLESEKSLKFCIPFQAQLGEEVYVVGSIPELGNWKVENSRKLQWNAGNVWTLESKLTLDQPFEYKYIVINKENNQVRWENSPNRKSGDITKSLNLNDTWEGVCA